MRPVALSLGVLPAEGSLNVVGDALPPGVRTARWIVSPGRAAVRYVSCQVRESSLLNARYVAARSPAPDARWNEPPVRDASSWSGSAVKSGPPMPMAYTAACAWAAAWTASWSEDRLETSRPSVTTTIARPDPLIPFSLFAARTTASYSAVPDFASTRSAPSWSTASAGDEVPRSSAIADRPNATIPTRSFAPRSPANCLADAIASARGRPRIDCDLSTASTIVFCAPRLYASSPTTALPFSVNRGWPLPCGAMTVTRSDGNDVASTPPTCVAAAAVGTTT